MLDAHACMVPRDPRIAAIADALRRYLESHPNASDSLEGVMRWWLASERVEAPQAMVRSALAHLVEDEVVEVRVLSDGTRVYLAGARARFSRP